MKVRDVMYDGMYDKKENEPHCIGCGVWVLIDNCRPFTTQYTYWWISFTLTCPYYVVLQ